MPDHDMPGTTHLDGGDRLLRTLFDDVPDAHMRRRDGSVAIIGYRLVGDIRPGVHLLLAQDVTEQRRAEASERFQAQLLEAVGEAVVATAIVGEPWQGEFLTHDREGCPVPVLATQEVYVDEAGAPAGVITIARDIPG